MKDEKNRPFHPAHQPWFNSIKQLKIKPYVPSFLTGNFRVSGIIGQIISLIQSFFIPRADLYILESISCMPCVIFKPGKKIIINTDTFFYDFHSFSGLKRKYVKWLVRNVDGIISTSQMMKEYAQKHTKAPNEVLIPFIDINKFLKVKPSNKKHSIICMNRSYSKGTDITVDVFKRYKKLVKDAKMYVCGLGEYKILNVDGIIDLGFCNNPAEIMKKTSIYINTARHEPFGVSIIEAIAAGQIPIISKFCGAKMFINKLDKKFITDLNQDLIVKTLLSLDKRRDLDEIRKNGKKIAKIFTKEKSISDFQNGLKNLLKQK